MAACVLQVLQQLESVHAARDHLLQTWHTKKTKLDQCFQLRLFEHDCEEVSYYIFFSL